MKIADAPPAGWYPDPERRDRLRWWNGIDWTDTRRALPSEVELEMAAALAETLANPPTLPPAPSPYGSRRDDTEQILAQVREVARSEVDRAADLFSQRASAATRQLQPLVTEYTNRALRLIRLAAVVAVLVVVLWVLFQVFVAANIFDWIGDRIDNLIDTE